MAVDVDTLLEQARQLAPEEQLRIIRNLISSITISAESDKYNEALTLAFDQFNEYIRQIQSGEVAEAFRILIQMPDRNVSLQATIGKSVVTDSRFFNGRPFINGTRIPVHHVAVWHDRLGMEPEEITAEYDLTLGDVHAALSYYYGHTDEINAAIRAEDELVSESLSRHPSKLKAKRGG